MKGHNYGLCRKCGKTHINPNLNNSTGIHAVSNNYNIEFNKKAYLKEYNKIYRQHNLKKLQIHNKKLNQIIRLETISHYSSGTNVCAWCGEDRIDGLSIDHIHGGGRKHKENTGNLYYWLKKHNYPEGYQVLCMNCQMEKVIMNNERHANKKPTLKQQKVREKNNRYENKLKFETFSTYSNGSIPHCKVCGKTNLQSLCLDHIYGGGTKDRKKLNLGGGVVWYRKLRKLGYPDKDKYQVLCHTCNQIKKRENTEYPNIHT